MTYREDADGDRRQSEMGRLFREAALGHGYSSVDVGPGLHWALGQLVNPAIVDVFAWHPARGQTEPNNMAGQVSLIAGRRVIKVDYSEVDSYWGNDPWDKESRKSMGVIEIEEISLSDIRSVKWRLEDLHPDRAGQRGTDIVVSGHDWSTSFPVPSEPDGEPLRFWDRLTAALG